MLQWILGYICLFQLWFSQGLCPGMGFLGHMVVLFLVFKGISILFSIVAVSIYILTNSPSPKCKVCFSKHILCIIGFQCAWILVRNQIPGWNSQLTDENLLLECLGIYAVLSSPCDSFAHSHLNTTDPGLDTEHRPLRCCLFPSLAGLDSGIGNSLFLRLWNLSCTFLYD